MDWYLKLTAWATVATAIATAALVLTGLGAMFFAWYQIRSERKYRRVENIEREIERFESKRYESARKLFAASRLTQGKELKPLSRLTAPPAAYEILDFFEHIGHLARAGHLEMRAVWHRFGWWILIMDRDARSLVDEERDSSNTVLCDFEWLVKKVSRVEKKEEGRHLNITPEKMISFYRQQVGADSQLSLGD
jgi:hypothetical protein